VSPGPRGLAAAAVVAVFAAASLVAWKGDAVLEKILYLRYGGTLPPPSYPAPRDAAEANRQDLDYLAGLTRVDRSFSPEASARFADKVRALHARADSLSRAGLFLGVAEAVALADNAHTNVNPAMWRALFDSLPVRFVWFADGLYVVRATADHADLLGAHVLAIDGIEPARWAEIARRFFGGTPEHARSLSALIMEAPAILHEIDNRAPGERVVLRVQDGTGRERAVEIAAMPREDAPPMVKAGRVALAEPLPGEKAGEWRALLADPPRVPAVLSEPEKTLYAEREEGDRVLYLHLWQIRESVPGSLANALREALGPLQWRRIVLDLRFNAGGEYETVYPVVKNLGAHLTDDGRLVVLTDATTFSAAIITAALAKYYLPGRTRIVGEKAGDRLAFWAEGTSITLPNSKIRIDISTGYHDWAHGCREMRCWWPNYFYGVAAGTIDPDVVVGWRFADYARGVDTVLERALD
jgi:hypothetical protein